MHAAFELLASGTPPGKALIPWLAGELALSERTLRRRFEAAFGYGPKTLNRILRFQRFLKLLRGARNDSTASLAVEAGYADQAHLGRETRRLAATTPGQIAALLTDRRQP
jgi:transcriptional regulator GlxA family with amidase domain